jgi:hypothetical protein
MPLVSEKRLYLRDRRNKLSPAQLLVGTGKVLGGEGAEKG